jgi:UDP-N-acetylmuramate--alanine ligase
VVVTHLERDHPDCFPDLAAMSMAFRLFLGQVPSHGTVVGCADAPNVLSLLKRVRVERSDVRMLTYGLEDSWDWVGKDVVANARGGSDFTVWQGSRSVGSVQLGLPGLHNVRNALGALAAAQQTGVTFDCARRALETFRGTERRFEVKGSVADVTVIDDYAHHPTQIRATLAAARRRYAARPLWVVFQPHTFSRTRMLSDQYARSFADADHVIVTDIYAAREACDPDVSSAMLVHAMTHPDARCIADLDDIVAYLLPRLMPGDVLITLGAGDGYKVGVGVLTGLGMEQDG